MSTLELVAEIEARGGKALALPGDVGAESAADGIRLNAVAPGFVRTPMWAHDPDRAVSDFECPHAVWQGGDKVL